MGFGVRAGRQNNSLVPILYDIARLTLQSFTDRFESRKSNCFCFSIFQDGDIGHCNADLLRQFGDAHFSLCEHHIDVDDNGHAIYTVKSFSDLISTAFCRMRSNTAAAVATTTETSIIMRPMATPPAISSLPRITMKK